jgi:hypothetical protein
MLCDECKPSTQKRSAATRRIPESYQRCKPIKHPFRNVILSILLLITIITGLYFGCEIYTIPPIDAEPEGATLIIWRNGDLTEPFFNSPDAAMSKLTAEESVLDVIPTSRVLFKLPYNEFCYLQSPTGEVPANQVDPN